MTDRHNEAPEQMLAAGFCRYVSDWATELGASLQATGAAAHAARHLVLASANGDVCLPLDQLPPDPDWPIDAATQRAWLMSSGVVAAAAQPGSHPMLLDDNDRLYLHRYFDYERRLAAQLVRLQHAAPSDNFDSPAVRQCLARQFQDTVPQADDGPDRHRLALAMILSRRLTVVSGGPGTGKTTLVVKLLACLHALDPDCRVALAAPTGKAASRMSEAIRSRAEQLPTDVRDRLPQEARTVHRLLGIAGHDKPPQYHSGNPLPLDALIVDEASMLDLSLATHLLEALPAHARLVMLGDKDQLAAVESGTVFPELCSNPHLSPGLCRHLAELTGIAVSDIDAAQAADTNPSRHALALQDTTIWLTRSYRFHRASEIGHLAAAIRSGDSIMVTDWLRRHDHAQVQWQDEHSAPTGPALMAAALDAYRPYLDAVTASRPSLEAVTHAFGSFRILCAVRDGPRGVNAINQALEQTLGQAIAQRLRGHPGPHKLSATQRLVPGFFPGRPILVRQNDYSRQLFNGDIGITMPDDSGQLMVWFPQTDGGFRPLAPSQLPAHDTAFAMSIHQSQGSEFDRVWVLLPGTASRVLSRELLYTGVTRARQAVTLLASEDVLLASVSNQTLRASGLAARLQEAMSSSGPRHTPQAEPGPSA